MATSAQAPTPSTTGYALTLCFDRCIFALEAARALAKSPAAAVSALDLLGSADALVADLDEDVEGRLPVRLLRAALAQDGARENRVG